MYLEVKGVTLEENGICRFPDAPTERGAKHLRELVEAKKQGYDAAVLFVIQMKPVLYLEPNDATDPEFGKALRAAAAAGVEIIAMDCIITEDTMVIADPVPVKL
jgi:sugar fermentation stimulation protein A